MLLGPNAQAWQHERAQLVADADTRVRNARREHEAAAETWQVGPAWRILLAVSSYDAILLKKRGFQMRVDGVAKP